MKYRRQILINDNEASESFHKTKPPIQCVNRMKEV